jgi:hypothetical protein
METKLLQLKNYLKNLAVEIKQNKKELKEAQRNFKDNKGGGGGLMYDLFIKRRNYRHHHIAYSEMRGKTREQIEKPRQDNLPNEDFITKIKKEYFDEPKTLCASA